MFNQVQVINDFSYTPSGNPTVTTAAVTKGNLLIVFCSADTNQFLMPDDGRNLWIPINPNQLAGGYGYGQAFYAIAESSRVLNIEFFGANPTGGSGVYYQAVPVTLSDGAMQFIELSGNSMNPFVIGGTETGTSTAPFATISPGFANLILISFATPDTTTDTLVPAAGWTSFSPGQNGSGIFAIESTPGTYSPEFVQGTSATWGCIAAAFKQPGTMFTISGSLGSLASGATVKFISETTGTIYLSVANSSGNYISPALENDTYIIQPQLLGIGFSPNAITGVAISGGNVTGQNFTAINLGTSLTMIQTIADSMTRANENPISDGGNWTSNGTPVPPWDSPFQILSNEAVLSNLTTVANYPGPFSADAVSVWGGSLPLSPPPGNQFYEIQVDAANGVAISHAGWAICARSSYQNTVAYFYTGTNNNDGTANLALYGIGSPTVPSAPGNLNNCALFRQPYAFWSDIVPFVTGDKFRIAVTGNNIFLLRNGSIIGTVFNPTPIPGLGPAMGTGVIYCSGKATTDIKLSNFSGGSAFSSTCPITDILESGQVGSGIGDPVGSLETATFGVAENDLIVAFIGYFQNAGQTITSVKNSAGVSYTFAGTKLQGTTLLACYYLQSPATIAADTVTVEFSAATVTYCDLTVHHVPQGIGFDNLTSAGSSSSVSNITPVISTAKPNEIVFAYVYYNNIEAQPFQSFPASFQTIGGSPSKDGGAYFCNSAFEVFTTPQSSLSVEISFNTPGTGAALLAAFELNSSSNGQIGAFMVGP